ncbi:hypothetical protein AHF37_07907 [Paragonimus kellicotti]|nr:hypothetical protein AHF37_07907 [Paragonimus kellicotti]
MRIFLGIISCLVCLTRQAPLSNGAELGGDPMFHILGDNDTYCLLADFNLTIDITYALKEVSFKIASASVYLSIHLFDAKISHFFKLFKIDWKEVSTNQVIFKTVVGKHFECEHEQSLGMYLSDSSKKETDASLKMTNTKIEAFMKSEKPEFSKQSKHTLGLIANICSNCFYTLTE